MKIISANITGSLILNNVDVSSITGSQSSINSLNNKTGSYAVTGSNVFIGNQNITGSVSVTGSLTTTGTIIAQTLNVQQVTSSVVYSSGSNIFGNSLSNTQVMTGSVSITGSLSVNGVTNTVGTGTTNTLPKFTGASTIGDSAITDDGTTVTLVSRALSGTSATFSGLVTGQTTSNGNITQNFLAYNSGTSISGASYDFQSGGTSQTARISANYEASSPDRMAMRFLVGQGSGLVEILKLFNSIMTVTGAATFSGGVTSRVNDGSAQFNAEPTTTTNSAYIQFLNSDGYGYIGKNSSAGGNLASGTAAYALVISTYKAGGTTAPIQFAPNNSIAATITSGGNVGIGTTDPLFAKLSVNGNISLGTYDGINTSFKIGRQRVDGAGYVNTPYIDFKVDSSSNGYITFSTIHSGVAGYPDAVTINYNGNVLIGTTSDNGYKLDIRSTSGNNFVNSYTQISSNGQQSGFVAQCLWSGSDRGVSLAMYKHASITNPATYISFWSGTSTFQYMHIDDSGVLRLSSSSGDIGTANGTIVGTQTSDVRLKNVKDSFNYGLNEILQINPIAFTFKNDANNTDKLGFSAQEMLNIIPESVYDTKNCIDGYEDTDDSMVKIPKSNDNVYGMDYTTLIPVLVKAIQEQQAQIEILKNNITQ
jgi:hypothetical protein